MTDTELMASVWTVLLCALYFMIVVMNHFTLSRADRALRLSDMTAEARALMCAAGYNT